MKNKIKRKKEQVYYWPFCLSQNLSKQNQIKVKNILPQISRAQVFLWQALNIYDDFLDKEAKSEELPIANQYYAQFLEIHYRLSLPADYYRLFNRILRNLNQANRTEILAPKLIFKNGKILISNNKILKRTRSNAFSAVQKSLALALGPLALISFCGYKMNDPKAKGTLNFFRYILAARQLSDDSFDWLEDLKRGLITDANRPIILTAQAQGLTIDLKRAPEIVNLLYASEAAPLIIKGLKKHCRAARCEVKNLDGKNPSAMLKLINPIERSYQEAEAFRRLVARN